MQTTATKQKWQKNEVNMDEISKKFDIWQKLQENTSQMGCRQAVRHGVLISAFPGSNPGTPAIMTGQIGI